MTWQLIAYPEEELCDIASISVRKALERMQTLASIVTAENIADATARLAAHDEAELDLLVISSTMPTDASASVGLTGLEPSKQFIKALKKRRPALPVIVVATTPDDGLAGFIGAFDATGLVTIGNDFGRTLIDRIRSLYATDMPSLAERFQEQERQQAARESALVQLDLHLGGDQVGLWRMSRRGNGECEASGMLQLDPQLLKTLVRRSKRLNQFIGSVADADDWIGDLDELSSDLRHLLFRNGNENMDCWDRFLTQREQVGGVSKSRIRVTVNDETHPVLVEALRDSGKAFGDSWVLNAPVFRRYAQQMNYPPLFVDVASRRGPLNCLVIEADDAAGLVQIGTGEPESFERLRHLGDEATAVEGLLRGTGGRYVERLSMNAIDDKLTEAVIAKLFERQWHVVHFCGHVGGGAGQASLILRATDDGALPVRRLTQALGRTQLLFLNACRSADTQVVMHAVEQSVSAVLGFQWKVEDKAALDFAIDFYGALFDPPVGQERSLEFALMSARKRAYQRRPEHPTWVAPVLVMQMS